MSKKNRNIWQQGNTYKAIRVGKKYNNMGKKQLEKGDTLYKYLMPTLNEIQDAVPQAKRAKFDNALKSNATEKRTLESILSDLGVDIDSVVSAKNIEKIEVLDIKLQGNVPGTEAAELSDGQRININGHLNYFSIEALAISALKDEIKKAVRSKS